MRITLDEILQGLLGADYDDERKNYVPTETQAKLDKHYENDRDGHCMLAYAQDCIGQSGAARQFIMSIAHLAQSHKIEQAAVLSVEILKFLDSCVNHIHSVETKLDVKLFADGFDRAGYRNQLGKWEQVLADIRKANAERNELLRAAAGRPN